MLSDPARAGYKITLQNGQTLDAETFAIKNSMITLKYKVGEVSFPMSMVKAVTDEEGKGDFLSGPASPVVKPAEPRTPAPAPQAVQPQPAEQPAAQPVATPPQAAPQTGLPGVIGNDQPAEEDNKQDNLDDLDIPDGVGDLPLVEPEPGQ